MFTMSHWSTKQTDSTNICLIFATWAITQQSQDDEKVSQSLGFDVLMYSMCVIYGYHFALKRGSQTACLWHHEMQKYSLWIIIIC